MDKKLTQLGKDLEFLNEVMAEIALTHDCYISASHVKGADLVWSTVSINGITESIDFYFKGNNKGDKTIADVFYE